jgi:multidrug/hemolysin transport system permease protein
MTTLTFILAEVYIVVFGGELLPLLSVLKVMGLIIVNVFSGAAIMFLPAYLIKSDSGYGAASTVLGTMIGFLTGIYIPIGVLPSAVQTFIKMVPAAHGTALMRQIFMDQPAAEVYANAPQAVKDHFFESMGVNFKIGESMVQPIVMIIVVVGAGLVFLGLSSLMMNKKRKNL